MGFSGGGTSLLKAHKHTSAVQDGGKLDMDNVTEAELTQGDVIFSDGAALQRLAIGAASDKLQVNAGATAPEWAASAGAFSVTTQVISPTHATTYTGLAFTTLTNGTGTLATRAGGKAMLTYFVTLEHSTTSAYVLFRWLIGGVAGNKSSIAIGTGAASIGTGGSVTDFHDLNGDSLAIQIAMSGGTSTIYNSATSGNTLGMVWEVS